MFSRLATSPDLPGLSLVNDALVIYSKLSFVYHFPVRDGVE